MKKHFLLIITLLLSFNIAIGQNTKKGDNAYEKGDYYKAIEEYTLLVDNVPDGATRSLLRYRIAESYRRMNRPEQAEKHYVNAIKAGYMSPEVYFGYGDVLLKLGKYDEAQAQFDIYRRATPGDKLVEAKIASCVFAKANLASNPYFNLQPLETINSRGSEFGVAYFNNNLIYASTGNPITDDEISKKDVSKKISLRTGLPYSKMYMSVPLNGVYQPGTEVVGLNKVDQTNEGTFSYDTNKQLGYYTRCDAGDNQCYVYYAEFKGNKWVEKGRLPVDGRKQSIGHPSFSPDGNRLYFVSAMEGGYGMNDIWYMDKLPDGKWSKAINLGSKVNTVGNEVFPFVIDGYLFFASDGHPGYGGWDIFASKIDGNAFGPAYNIGMPFNSPADDFNLIERVDLSEGILVSSRRGAKSSDDIYRFEGFPHSLVVSGKVYDSISGQPLPKASIELHNKGKLVDTISVSDSGTYVFYVMPKTEYELKASQLTYTSKSVNFKTEEERFGRLDNINIALNSTEATIAGVVYDIETKLPLPNIPIILYEGNNPNPVDIKNSDANGGYQFADIKPNTAYIVKHGQKEYYAAQADLAPQQILRSTEFSKANGFDMDLHIEKVILNKQITIDNILYDYGKATLRPESLVELDKLINDVLIKSPQLKLQISSHTDSRGSHKVNDRLSEQRAKSVVDYLISRGIDPNRLTWKGYGKRDLLVKNARTEDQHQQNRRTTFMVTGLMDMPLFDTSIGSATVSVPTAGQGSVSATRPSTPTTSTPSTPASGLYSNPNGQFRIQISGGSSLNLNTPEFARLSTQLNLQVFYEYDSAKRWYRYFVGGYSTREEANAMLTKVKATGFPSAFINVKNK